MTKFKVVHYINQFYAGIGGEEKADIQPFSKAEVVGPGLHLAMRQKSSAPSCVATVSLMRTWIVPKRMY